MPMATCVAAVGDADGDRLAVGARFDGVLKQMADRLLERGGIDRRVEVGIADQPDLVVAALCGDRRGEQRPKRLRVGAVDAGAGVRRQAGEKVVHLADGRLQRGNHVGAELGVVGVALGVAGKQRELADEVLHVVEDEGEAAIEFLEPLGVGQRFLAVRFGKRTRGLAPGGAQQVEILPVERAAVFGRGKQDDAHQPFVVDERDAGPDARSSSIPSGPAANGRPDAPAAAQCLEFDDPAAAFDLAPEVGALVGVSNRRVGARPIPRGGARDGSAGIVDQQQAARRSRRSRRRR